VAVKGAWKGFFMLDGWIQILVAFCLSFYEDRDGAGEVGSGVGTKGCLEFLRHVIHGLSGGTGLVRVGSTRESAFTYCVHEGTEEVDPVLGLEDIKEWVRE
jgi:hypothetical protein